jgi:integrase
MLLTDAIAAYLDDLRERQLTAVHIRTVSYRLSQFAKSRPAGQLIEPLTRAELAGHFIKLREGKSDGTMAGYTSTHKAFWRFAKNEGWTKTNLGKRLKKYSYKPVVRKAAPAADLATVLSKLNEFAWHRDGRPRDVRDALLVSLSLDAGARRAAMWGLRRTDVERSLHRGRVAKNGRIMYQVESYVNKTGTVTLEFCQETAELFQLHFERAPYTRLDLVFYSLSTGEIMKPASLSRAFDRACKFAGVPVFRSHAVRKRNGSAIIQQLHAPDVAQMYLGHQELSTTLRHYNDHERDDVSEAAAQLASLRRGERDVLAEQFFKKKE